MIRSDPDRPGVTIVDVANYFVAELSEEWSRPIQVKIEDGELVFRNLEAVELIGTDPGPELSTFYRISSRGDEEASS